MMNYRRPITLDKQRLLKYLRFFAHTADEILKAQPGEDASTAYVMNDFEVFKSRYSSLASEHKRFLELLDASPRINPQLKERIVAIALTPKNNPRIGIFRRVRMWFPQTE
jgi:hypothetical protein